MTKQAPLPWTLTQNSWQYTTIYDAEGNHVCRLDLEDWSVTEENQDDLEKVQTQIASRIVKGVNEYEDAYIALMELCGRHSFATGHGDTLADIIREIDGQIGPRDVGRPES